MKRSACYGALAWILGAVLTGCGGEKPAVAEVDSGELMGKVVLTGSSTVAPLMTEIALRFESLHPKVRVDVQTGGSSRGISDARAGVADIGMVSRSLADDEVDLDSHTIARDGVCLIVHRDNPVNSLTDEQVRAIYTGQITDWQEVGGQAGPITVVTKADGRATLEVFRKYLGLETAEMQADVVIGDNQQGIKTVAGSPSAIGYVSIGAADFEARRGTPIRLVASGGVVPTSEAVAQGEFPISRPLNLVTFGTPSFLASVLLDYAASEAAHDLIEAQLFVPAGS